MGMFDGYEGIKPDGERGTPPLGEAECQFTITRCEAPQNLRIGEAFIGHYTVDASSRPDQALGVECTWFQGFKDQPEAARAAVLSFMIALAGQRRDTPGAAQVQAAIGPLLRASCSAANPFRGLRGIVKTSTRAKKNKPGETYIRQDFYPMPGCEGNLAIMLAAAQQVASVQQFAATVPPVPGAYGGPPAPFLPPPQYTPPPAPGYAPPAPTASAPPPFVPPPTWPAPPPGYMYGPGGAIVPAPKI